MPESKQRHGCLTAFLIFITIANAGTALFYLLRADVIRSNLPGMPGWAIPLLIALAIFNLACAVALFNWKKWGFWGFCASGAVVFVVNLTIGVGIGPALAGLIGIAIL